MRAQRRPSVPDALLYEWRTAWPQALAAWSRYTRLHDARLCRSSLEAAQEGLKGSFAMIRLLDQRVVIDLQAVAAYGLQDYAVEILAHEIGHHVLAPGNATDHLRMLARIRRALPSLERQAPMIANLYTDLCINDRLQRQAGLRMAEIYRALERHRQLRARQAPASSLWTLYMRIYEQLWKLDKGSLAGAAITDAIDTDAWLGARLIRAYATESMAGAGRFAALVLPYLVDDAGALDPLRPLHDTGDAAAGCTPGAVHDVEPDELVGAPHPVHDPRVTGEDVVVPEPGLDPARQSTGQAREPFEYGEILKAAGIALDDHEIAVRYYRERALPHLVALPAKTVAREVEPQPAGVEPWEIGESIDDIDWLHSIALSPIPIPGLTTVRRHLERDAGSEREQVPVDLDIYVDSSGSMPNPQQKVSYLALAGAIIALSALRAGAAVQATLWSGKNQVQGTNGFVRYGDEVLRVMTGFFGGATCFPIDRLRDTYGEKQALGRPVRILMISDDGITTMFEQDEQGNSGWDVAARALRNGAAGGTMALNLDPHWAWDPHPGCHYVRDLLRAGDEQGWEIHAVADMAQLVDFARAFSRRHYGAARRPPVVEPGKRP
ncbi:VWA domain-containing protein [Telluria beijingensis]|uniref:VWA domain-containing protein n=1 Tax=Telluria beijingensis TaxID=3068633 RepID=UPI002795298C|nr:VWA domain-containing protein [Massilia sp. REN29]